MSHNKTPARDRNASQLWQVMLEDRLGLDGALENGVRGQE
jgi:hypothetical protein